MRGITLTGKDGEKINVVYLATHQYEITVTLQDGRSLTRVIPALYAPIASLDIIDRYTVYAVAEDIIRVIKKGGV